MSYKDFIFLSTITVCSVPDMGGVKRHVAVFEILLQTSRSFLAFMRTERAQQTYCCCILFVPFLFFCLCKTGKYVERHLLKSESDRRIGRSCTLQCLLKINISNIIILHLMQPVNIVLNKCLLWSRYCELFSKSNIMLLKVCQFQNGLRQEDKEVEVISSFSRLVQVFGAVLCNIV